METVERAGEEWLRVSLHQMKDCLEMDLKIHPLVEEYFSNMSQGRTDLVDSSVGNGLWYSPTGVAIRAYRIGRTPASQNTNYSYDYLGYGFWNEELGNGTTGLNMAFLRIVGASAGVKLGFKTPMSLPARRELKESIGSNFRRFVREHLTPVRLELIVTAREFRG